MSRNTCAGFIEGLFIEHSQDIQTVSKQARPSLFRFDTRRNSNQGKIGNGKNFQKQWFNMDDTRVLVYIRSVQRRFQSDSVSVPG